MIQKLINGTSIIARIIALIFGVALTIFSINYAYSATVQGIHNIVLGLIQ